MTRRALLALTGTALASSRKNRAPVSHEMVGVKLPEATPTKLSNGLTLLTMEDDRFPLVWAWFHVDGAGLVYSPSPGVAQVTAEMLAQGSSWGSTQRSAKQVAEDAATLGATLQSGVFANRETAVLNGTGLSGKFYDWLAICAGCLISPSFTADEFNSLRERWRVSMHLKMAEPAMVAQDEILRLIYGSHPAGQGDPTPAEISALTPEAAAAWHRARYAPANTVLSVIGRVKPSEVAARMEKLLGSWNAPAPQFSLPPEPQPAEHRRISLFDRKGAAQTSLEIGNLLSRRSDPQYFAMVVLQRVLGGGGDSRLQRMLEDSGEALNVSSTESTPHYTGYWRISAAMRTEATGRALSTILGELRRLCDEPIAADEIERAKSAVTGSFALTLEHPREVIGYSYQRNRYGFSNDYWESYPSRIQAVTAAEVQAVARKYYQPDRAHIVAVGDGARIRADLANLGAIE